MQIVLKSNICLFCFVEIVILGVTGQELGRRIMELRKFKGLSQHDLSRFLDISRSSMAQIEAGNRNVSVFEMIKLSETLGFSMDKFLAKDYKMMEDLEEMETTQTPQKDMRISVPAFSLGTFKNVLLYISEHCAGKPNVGETVLYKLLYFADFNYYEKYEEHLTGSQYRKLPYGPVPQKLDSILAQMIANGQLQRIKTQFHGYPQTRYLPLEKADLTQLNAAAKEVLDQVIDRFSDWSASAISDYSHRDMPWKASADGELIDYELAFYRESPFSARTYVDDPERP